MKGCPLEFVPGFLPIEKRGRGGSGPPPTLMTDDHRRQLQERPGEWAILRLYATNRREKNCAQQAVHRCEARFKGGPWQFGLGMIVADDMPGWAVMARYVPPKGLPPHIKVAERLAHEKRNKEMTP